MEQVWNVVTRPIFNMFDMLNVVKEKRRLRRSHINPIVRQNRRDSVKYYENGRSVTVGAELTSGRDFDRMIYRQCPLKWDDAGATLTPEEKGRVFQTIGAHFDCKKVGWKFSDASCCK